MYRSSAGKHCPLCMQGLHQCLYIWYHKKLSTSAASHRRESTSYNLCSARAELLNNECTQCVLHNSLSRMNQHLRCSACTAPCTDNFWRQTGRTACSLLLCSAQVPAFAPLRTVCGARLKLNFGGLHIALQPSRCLSLHGSSCHPVHGNFITATAVITPAAVAVRCTGCSHQHRCCSCICDFHSQ